MHQLASPSHAHIDTRTEQLAKDTAHIMVHTEADSCKPERNDRYNVAYHVLKGSQLRIQQLSKMLVILAYLEMVMPFHHSIKGLQAANHNLQQGRLASPIGTHQSHS